MYLRVPFSEKESARNLGARWDAETRFWYVPHGYDIHPFRRWWPLDLAIASMVALIAFTCGSFGSSSRLAP
jgi:hypothetical protein